MSLIVVLFLISYSAIHYYVLTRIRAAFPLSARSLACLGFFLAFMALSPFMLYLFERHASHLAARIFAYVAYSWMGMIFFFFCISLLFPLYRLVIFLSESLLSRGLSAFLPGAGLTFLIALIGSLLLFAYGLYEVNDFRMERLVVRTSKLPAGVKRIRVVQISDLHIGLIMQGERLRRVAAKIRAANPDLLVSTGDLVDGLGDDLSAEYPVLQGIAPPLGKFAVTGNHELYAGLDRSLDFTRRAGFTLLRAEGRVIPGLMNIAGIDDAVVRKATGGGPGAVSFRMTLDALPKDKFTLFLYHRPEVEDAYRGLFDLQISGHTHKGQIFPFCLVTRLFFPMQAGDFTLPGRSLLHVSRGTGTWGPPIRFLSPPEITVIDVVGAR